MKQKSHLFSYVLGFLISLLLTLWAYFPVVLHEQSLHRLFSHEVLIPYVLILAVMQLCTQLFFFLHLGRSNARLKLLFFVSTISVTLLIVVASMWIMSNLNYNMMPKDIGHYMQDEEMIHK